MKKLILKRVAENEDGTFGVLIDGNTPFALTLERNWLDNKPNESCIPAGEYVCKRIISPRFGKTFEVTNVPGRSHILFHTGNLEEHSKGCILIGEEFGYLNGKVAVLSSRKGFKEFMDRLKGLSSFEIEIKYA